LTNTSIGRRARFIDAASFFAASGCERSVGATQVLTPCAADSAAARLLSLSPLRATNTSW
jgi:hypothetical protein